MAQNANVGAFASNELFRFVRFPPLEIVDLRMRAQTIPDLKRVLSTSSKEQRDWARKFLKSSDSVTDRNSLEIDYQSIHNNKILASQVQEPRPDNAPNTGMITAGKSFKSDVHRTIKTILAHKITGNEEAARTTCQILQEIEISNDSKRSTSYHRIPAPVLQKFEPKLPPEPTKPPETNKEGSDASPRDLRKLGEDIELLWRARNELLKISRKELQDKLKEQRQKRRATGAPKIKPGKIGTKQAKAAARAYASHLKTRRMRLEKDRADFRSLENANALGDILTDSSRKLASVFNVLSDRKLKTLQHDVKRAMQWYDLKGNTACHAYSEIVRKADATTLGSTPQEITDVLTGCFLENPRIKFATSIRPLGCGELVKVEETFLKYTEGEINYIENILAGEIRKREIKDTKYAEQITETETLEASEITDETSSKVSSDLKTQVESELNTRFNTNVNATASGSGGGSIGVVDFNGSAALNAGFGIGVDTSLATSTQSEFAQEVLSKSVEKTKTSTLKRRIDRSYSLYETTNSHEINNTIGNNIIHRRGIYCFLDKHICISQSVYGQRMFLMANVNLPGKNLLCEQKTRRIFQMQEIGTRPVFDITPNDIHPGTYKDYAGKYNASNISPPPDPIINLARTYKTDQTNANMEKGGGFDLKKVADTLVPFFEQYQRHLVTDTIKLPDGYQVQEVCVSVNHGANGISVPAHLPITVAGATAYSLPLLGYAALMPLIYLPIAVWQIAYLSSPIMHYNVDSSNVTVCVGTESQDSPYYFFEPDFLVAELFDLLGNFAALTPGILNTIRSEANSLFTNLQTNAAAVPPEVVNLIRDALNGIVTKVNTAFNAVIAALDPTSGELAPTPDGELKDISDAMADLAQSITVEASNLQDLMGDLFEPVKTFFDNIFLQIQEGIEDSISDFFAFLLAQSENSQKLLFTESYGVRRELPVSLNAVSIKPGITINLVACLRRTEEALDKWRLETFGALYQAYLQQTAEYESRNFAFEGEPRLTRSPGTMRSQEHLALKEILLHALNNYHGGNSNQYSLDSINLFENAVDWDNISYKLHNYGPNFSHVQLERLGIFEGSDARRKAFLTAHWAQVMIPLQPNERLVRRMLIYFDSGEADLEADFTNDELTALYQALVQDRDLLDDPPEVTYQPDILPTDLVVLKLDDDELPSNPDAGCV